MKQQLENVYSGKKIFITGHTGFKGSWLALFLQQLNATVTGYALAPNTSPDHFSISGNGYKSIIGNILDTAHLSAAIAEAQPDIIFHLAAQPLVRASYTEPLNTYQTNVIGTLNVLEAGRNCASVKAILCITTDKVYENVEQSYAYKETDRLGGYDMYSSSKACCEILIDSYRNSFLPVKEYGQKHEVLIASARAGNVIGGGDWCKDRLLPDIVRAASVNEKVIIRNPVSVRPWQHVLDCLYGYVLLGANLLQQKKEFATAYNFAPLSAEVKTVQQVIDMAFKDWDKINIEYTHTNNEFHEATLLQLDSTKAIRELQWQPLWDTAAAVHKTILWYKAFYENETVLTTTQITEYLNQVTQ